MSFWKYELVIGHLVKDFPVLWELGFSYFAQKTHYWSLSSAMSFHSTPSFYTS